jgi:hypothetical protein
MCDNDKDNGHEGHQQEERHQQEEGQVVVQRRFSGENSFLAIGCCRDGEAITNFSTDRPERERT